MDHIVLLLRRLQWFPIALRISLDTDGASKAQDDLISSLSPTYSTPGLRYTATPACTTPAYTTPACLWLPEHGPYPLACNFSLSLPSTWNVISLIHLKNCSNVPTQGTYVLWFPIHYLLTHLSLPVFLVCDQNQAQMGHQ